MGVGAALITACIKLVSLCTGDVIKISHPFEFNSIFDLASNRKNKYVHRLKTSTFLRKGLVSLPHSSMNTVL